MRNSKTESHLSNQIFKLSFKDIFSHYHLLEKKSFRVKQVSSQKHRNVTCIHQYWAISNLHYLSNYSFWVVDQKVRWFIKYHKHKILFIWISEWVAWRLRPKIFCQIARNIGTLNKGKKANQILLVYQKSNHQLHQP